MTSVLNRRRRGPFDSERNDLYGLLRWGRGCRPGKAVTIATFHYPYGIASFKTRRLVHTVSRVAILWRGGTPAAFAARWRCGDVSTFAALIPGPPDGWEMCKPCGTVDVTAGPYVYFAERDGLVKIGWSGHPCQRALGLKASLLAVVPGSRQDERIMHERFAGDRVAGEWFRPSPALVEYVDALKAAVPS